MIGVGAKDTAKAQRAQNFLFLSSPINQVQNISSITFSNLCSLIQSRTRPFYLWMFIEPCSLMSFQPYQKVRYLLVAVIECISHFVLAPPRASWSVVDETLDFYRTYSIAW